VVNIMLPLFLIVAAWSELPDAIKARIVGLVEGAVAARSPVCE
jgi:hypothetical protein